MSWTGLIVIFCDQSYKDGILNNHNAKTRRKFAKQDVTAAMTGHEHIQWK
jgi:hypothetical protein